MIFFKKSIVSSGVMRGITDCHSHILPGVDDGIKSEQEACEALAYLETQGVQRVILTPHIMEDYPRNTNDFLNAKFRSLCDTYHGSIELELGGEYMLNSAFEQQLDRENLLPLFDDHLLVETSCMYPPANLEGLIKKIQSQGYHILLAHPERYLYMSGNDYKQLKRQNVKFQLNILSLVGAYGRHAQSKSRKLLNEGCYEFMGSDLHNLQSFEEWSHKKQLSSMVVDRLKRHY